MIGFVGRRHGGEGGRAVLVEGSDRLGDHGLRFIGRPARFLRETRSGKEHEKGTDISGKSQHEGLP